MVLRKAYLDRIKSYINLPIIKVITGMRRVGKSYLIKQIIDLLKEDNIDNSKIVYINKELLEFDFIKDYKDLYKYIKEYFNGVEGSKYIFIDEVQEVNNWEKAIMSFFAEEEYDIYITGSNSNLLSSELTTLLSGRYIEIDVYTLGFNEFLDFRNTNVPNLDKEFMKYLKYGGFPVIHKFKFDEEVTYLYIKSLYSTIILKDVIGRHKIRNARLFQDITKFVFSNIGHIVSSNSISKYLKHQKIIVGIDTIQNYLSYLESGFMIHRVQRYDIKGKKVLELYEKYYLGDISLKNAIIGYKADDISALLENIVFLKLKQDGYSIFIGKFDDLEVDFIAEKKGIKIYIQVAYLLKNTETIKREFTVLSKIKDNYPKYVITMDNFPESDNNGIKRINIIDFLLK